MGEGPENKFRSLERTTLKKQTWTVLEPTSKRSRVTPFVSSVFLLGPLNGDSQEIKTPEIDETEQERSEWPLYYSYSLQMPYSTTTIARRWVECFRRIQTKYIIRVSKIKMKYSRYHSLCR